MRLYVVEPPCVTVWLDGEELIVKSGVVTEVLKLAPETVRPVLAHVSVHVWVVVPVPGPMSPPTSLESMPHFFN